MNTIFQKQDISSDVSVEKKDHGGTSAAKQFFRHKIALSSPPAMTLLKKLTDGARRIFARKSIDRTGFFLGHYEPYKQLRKEWRFFATLAALLLFIATYHFFYIPPRD